MKTRPMLATHLVLKDHDSRAVCGAHAIFASTEPRFISLAHDGFACRKCLDILYQQQAAFNAAVRVENMKVQAL